MDIQSLELRIARSVNLPVLPQVVSSALKMIDQPDTGARDLEQLIETDLGITAKILRVANSSYYGFSNIESVGRAVSCLGMNTIRSLIIGVAFQQLTSGQPQSTSFNRLEFWRHSLATATAARIIGKLTLPAKSNELYDAAIMHDIGLLVLDRFSPSELDHSLATACEDKQPLHVTERRLFGYTHADIGAILADRWGLNGLLKNAIKYHHDPFDDHDHPQTTCIVAIANLVAHQCGYNNNVPSEAQPLDPMLLEAVGIKEEQYAVISSVLAAEVAKAEEALQIAA